MQILPDIPRLYTALAEWLACLMCIMTVKRKITGWKLAGVSGLFFCLQASFLVLTKQTENHFWWLVCMAAAVIFMYDFIYYCSDMNRKDAAYYCVHAFVIAEFAASLEWQLDCYFYYSLELTSPMLGAVCLVIVYSLVYAVIFLLYRRPKGHDEALAITNGELFSGIVIAMAVFMMSNLGFTNFSTPFSGQQRSEIFNIRTIIDLGGVAILYAYHVQRLDFRMRKELESVQAILHNQYVQYKQSQEAMDIINYKYHDLKHHIIALRAEENAEKRNDYLDEMEEKLKSYEAHTNTGNQVLDTLLTSKNLYCMKNNISVTSVVDGTLFGFMDTMDICSIFGNAFDNAIECEKKIQDKEKRLIHISAFSQRNFLIVRFENYCESELTFNENLPVTTKKSKEFHGYGLKSIRYTVQKYGGEVDVSVEDNWFILKVLIPLP